MMSFGIGIILSAIALVLIPKGLHELSLLGIIIAFVAGTILFMLIDIQLAKAKGKMATLLAVFIGLQTLPEAFNAFRDFATSGWNPNKVLGIFFVLSFFGVISAVAGHLLLQNHPDLTAYLMTFASGGILYLLIRDFIPESKMFRRVFPSSCLRHVAFRFNTLKSVQFQ